MTTIQARWLASLSDGSIAIEGKLPYQEIPDEPSPWQRLQLDLARAHTHITGIRIQLEKDGQPIRTYNLPSTSPKQKWGHLNPMLPIRFNYFRRVSRKILPMNVLPDGRIEGYMGDAQTDRFIEIHAIYKDFTLITIVEENEGNESWSIIVPREAYHG